MVSKTKLENIKKKLENWSPDRNPYSDLSDSKLERLVYLIDKDNLSEEEEAELDSELEALPEVEVKMSDKELIEEAKLYGVL